METGLATVNEGEFYYEMKGAGAPVVLLHAGIADRRMWDSQFEVLSQQYQTIRYDRRGFGNTALTDVIFSNYEDLHDLLAYWQVERPILVGCSQGGRISIDFALAYPQKVQALVLVTSALSGFRYDGPPPPQDAEIDAADEAGDIARINELEIQVWVDGPHRTPDEVDPAVRALALDMNMIALEAPDVGDIRPLTPPAVNRLSEIQVPTLIMVGALDTPRTLAIADYLEANIPQAERVTIAETAHLLNMEEPELFNTHLLQFLARLP